MSQCPAKDYILVGKKVDKTHECRWIEKIYPSWAMYLFRPWQDFFSTTLFISTNIMSLTGLIYVSITLVAFHQISQEHRNSRLLVIPIFYSFYCTIIKFWSHISKPALRIAVVVLFVILYLWKNGQIIKQTLGFVKIKSYSSIDLHMLVITSYSIHYTKLYEDEAEIDRIAARSDDDLPFGSFSGGLFDDDGTPINLESIPVPGLCVICKHYQEDDAEENLLCQLNRYDQQNSPDFQCGAFEKM